MWRRRGQFIKLVLWLTVFNFVESEFAELITTELMLLASHDWKLKNLVQSPP
jgi:hypothetical protein